MLYSDILLEAVKLASFADADNDALQDSEKQLYAGYLRSAVARFNNNPNVSIGTEKVIVHSWSLDRFSYFVRLVRGDYNDLLLFDEGSLDNPETNVSKIKWRGVSGSSIQELPQRLISASIRESSATPRTYTIVNEKNFFELGKHSDIISYVVEENQGIVRVWRPEPLLLLFDRAILFPWEAKPEESKNAETGFHDPLDVQIMIPASHVPYLISLTALEIASGNNCEESLIAQIKDQLASQEKVLMSNNVRDRVKTSFSNINHAANFWYQRGL